MKESCDCRVECEGSRVVYTIMMIKMITTIMIITIMIIKIITNP